MAGPFSRPRPDVSHFVPADKRLDPEWVRRLYERGERHAWSGRQLNTIGMPVGGIAAGHVYLLGDGALGCWQIFRETYFSGFGASNYVTLTPARPLEQGFALVLEGTGNREQGTESERRGDEGVARAAAPVVRELNRQGFPGVEFNGEYPIGTVRYAAADCPVRVTLEAFSPFIPLNAKQSALPATLLHFTLENTTAVVVRAGLLGWLENAVGCITAGEFPTAARRRTRRMADAGATYIVHTAEAEPQPTSQRPDIVLADFEGDTYGEWKTEGTAFGSGPVRGPLPHQNPVSGFVGRGLVNSFRGGDSATGTLTSPSFVLERRYLRFLIGGGDQRGRTCMNLCIDGKVVRTATGRNEERLRWRTWDVQEFAGRSATIEIVDQATGGWGHINVDEITLSDRPRFGDADSVEQLEDFGSLVLALGEAAAPPAETAALLDAPGVRSGEFVREVDAAFALSERRSGALATPRVELRPGEQRTFTFVVAWHFANRVEGEMYTNRFADAAAVARHVLEQRERLTAQTRLWRDTYYDSTLPRWLLDRLHFPVANLATGTCRWWKSGRFWAWEGVGCCEGTCTHVWNYAHAMARLFPELERSVREMQDLGAALHDDGLVGFRGAQNRAHAADGQAGTVLKCYREHLMSADDAFLRTNWPKIKRVLEFSLRQDPDSDGLIEATQHNTYDINFEGANTFVGSLYLAALRAGEAMAQLVGDEAFAARCRAVFESGAKRSVERLWNGEYFIQDVDLEKHPRDQYGDGCLSDQLFGQGWAHQLDLGYLYPREHVQAALRAIWKYNWAPDIGPQNAAHKPERWFVAPGEAGLFTCTWPGSAYLKEGVRYREEVWTGIEYQVAGHMVWEGMLDEALVMLRAIHDRYDPGRHNPYNEVECGDHYARALASWGVYLALCGFAYDGPRGAIAFHPRISPDDFRAAFVAAAGWGTFEQKRLSAETPSFVARLTMRQGELRLTQVSLSTGRLNSRELRVSHGGRAVRCDFETAGERTDVILAAALTLRAGEVLEIAGG